MFLRFQFFDTRLATGRRPKVSETEYVDFYRRVSNDWAPPFKTIPLKAEGTIEYQALLFIPAQAPYDMFYHVYQGGLRLYAKRVMVMENCAELLPNFLRFVKGMGDSSDLSLNISRQTLQHLTEPADDLLAQSLWDYDGKNLRSASEGALKLGDNQEEKEKAQAELKKKEEEAADLFAAMQKALNSVIHVFGHSHIDFDQVIEGVRYVHHAFDYLREEGWSKDPLKQIWESVEQAEVDCPRKEM